MKTKWKLIVACLMLSSSVIAQDQYAEELELDNETTTSEIAEAPNPETHAIFHAAYNNRKMYFVTNFGTDNRAVIDIYSSNGFIVLSLNVESSDKEAKRYVFKCMDKYGYKMPKGNYTAVFTAKGKDSKKETIALR